MGNSAKIEISAPINKLVETLFESELVEKAGDSAYAVFNDLQKHVDFTRLTEPERKTAWILFGSAVQMSVARALKDLEETWPMEFDGPESGAEPGRTPEQI